MDPDASKLFDLVQGGDLRGLKELVEDTEANKRNGASLLDAVHGFGWTVLHYAAFRNHPSIIQWLLSSEEGGGRAVGFTKILVKDVNGQTALHVAAQEGHLECCQAMVEGCKIENGERAELLSTLSEGGWTVLHFASFAGRESTIRWILSSEGGRAAGFNNILAKDKSGYSALFRAVESGHLECCQALVESARIENGERAELLHGVDNEGNTVLHRATLRRCLPIIQWLLSSEEGGGRAVGFDKVLAKDNNGYSALFRAVERGYLEGCQALVESAKIESGERAELLNGVDNEGNTVLQWAMLVRRLAIIQWLLSFEEGGGRAAGLTSSSITAMNDELESALHLVGSVECLNALLCGCTMGERLTLFLSVDNHGWTVLHVAARWCRNDIIRELLLRYPETQTIVDHRDYRGMTALHRAVIGGVDKKSRKEWKKGLPFRNYGQAEVVAALLTFPKKIDIGKEDRDEPQQQSEMEDEERQEDNQQQQAAMVDPNLGTKIEQNLSEN